MERLKAGFSHLLGKTNEPIVQYSSPLEQSVAEMPTFSINQQGRDISLRDLKWREWAQKFLPLYETADQQLRLKVDTTISEQPPLRLLDTLIAIWEVGGQSLHKRQVAEIFKTVGSHYKDQAKNGLSQTQYDFLSYLNKSAVIPDTIKKDFPRPTDGREQVFSKIETATSAQATAQIILERLLNPDSLQINIDALAALLEKMTDGTMQLPTDNKFFRRVIRNYGDSRKIRKLLKDLSQQHPQWYKDQTRYRKGKKS